MKPIGLFSSSESTVKKLFAIAFTCVYLTLTVGVVRTTHYCMGRVNSTVLFSFEAKKCPCAVFMRAGAESCCDDDHDLIKIETDHAASLIVSIAPQFFEMGTLFNTNRNSEQVLAQPVNPLDENPPPLYSPSLFTQHCSLVFYDSLV